MKQFIFFNRSNKPGFKVQTIGQHGTDFGNLFIHIWKFVVLIEYIKQPISTRLYQLAIFWLSFALFYVAICMLLDFTNVVHLINTKL